MAAQHVTDDATIKKLINKHVEAIRIMDLDSVVSIYAPDIVSFDLDPPLQYAGAEAKRKRWGEVFSKFQSPLGYEIRDLSITLGDDVGFAHSLNRISGTLQNGNRSDSWVRWTTCFRKLDGKWFVAHEQVSVPVDPESGKALLDLQP